MKAGAKRAIGWTRGAIMAVGASSVTFAGQITDHVHTPQHKDKIQIAGIVLFFLAGYLKAGEKNQTTAQIQQGLANHGALPAPDAPRDPSAPA
jgi:hypothetical protein